MSEIYKEKAFMNALHGLLSNPNFNPKEDIDLAVQTAREIAKLTDTDHQVTDELNDAVRLRNHTNEVIDRIQRHKPTA